VRCGPHDPIEVANHRFHRLFRVKLTNAHLAEVGQMSGFANHTLMWIISGLATIHSVSA
jgi:hypothetical protein